MMLYAIFKFGIVHFPLHSLAVAQNTIGKSIRQTMMHGHIKPAINSPIATKKMTVAIAIRMSVTYAP
jgi:hypothetical protein